MRAKMLMSAVVAAGLTIASSAGAEEFTCRIPWHKDVQKCSRVFALRPGEKMVAKLIWKKDDDGYGLPDGVYFRVVDTNTGELLTRLYATRSSIVPYTNNSKKELIVQLDVESDKMKAWNIKGEYTVTP